MIDRRNRIRAFSMILVTVLPNFIQADGQNDVYYHFTQSDSSYTFYGSFKIHADPECLLEICFNHEHISALAQDAKEVSLIDQGNNWNQISYSYQKYIFFENKTVWHREISKEKQRVDFILISSDNNRAMMPRIISSSGFYQIRSCGESILVEYYQACEISVEPITKLYLNRMKKEAVDFIYQFSEYAMVHCKKSPFPNK